MYIAICAYAYIIHIVEYCRIKIHVINIHCTICAYSAISTMIVYILINVISSYGIDTIARKAQRLKRIRDGRCLIKGFFTLKWKYWAAIMKRPIRIDGIKINDECQIPTTINVANEILDAPTKLRIKSLSLNSLNSLRTLWNLKIHT